MLILMYCADSLLFAQAGDLTKGLKKKMGRKRKRTVERRENEG